MSHCALSPSNSILGIIGIAFRDYKIGAGDRTEMQHLAVLVNHQHRLAPLVPSRIYN